MFEETNRAGDKVDGFHLTLRNLLAGFVMGSVIGAILFTWQAVTGASGIFLSLF